MGKIELLNSCYKFFNQFINANELLEELAKIDTDNGDYKNFVEELKKKEKTIPNKEDEYIKQRKDGIREMLDKLKGVSEEDELIGNHVKNLKKDLEREYDSYERWFALVDFINSNKYFNNCFESLTKEELLDFITQYIRAPFPPQLTEEEFKDLVNIGIEKDDRESLWRLAFNYENAAYDLNNIALYYIKKKDGYYLSELICAVGNKLDMDKIIDKIKDKKLIKDIEERKDILKSNMKEEQFNRLFSK